MGGRERANPGPEADAEGRAAEVWREVPRRDALPGAGGVGPGEESAAERAVSDARRTEHGAADGGGEEAEQGGGDKRGEGERGEAEARGGRPWGRSVDGEHAVAKRPWKATGREDEEVAASRPKWDSPVRGEHSLTSRLDVDG